MKTLRHYFIGSDLDELELFEKQLESAGVETPQIHVLTDDDTGAADHHRLHEVQSLMKKDIIHAAEVGALIGLVAGLSVLLFGLFSGLADEVTGMWPFIFLAIIVLGFCTWEGGLFGIQAINVRFKRFEDAVAQGRHVFFVDLRTDQEAILQSIIAQHPHLEVAGTEAGTPGWIHQFRKWIFWFVDRNFLSQSQINRREPK